MICGDVVDEGAHNLVVAHAAVQPAQEEDELHAYRNESSHDGGPMDGHGRSFLNRKHGGQRRQRKQRTRTGQLDERSMARLSWRSSESLTSLPSFLYFPGLSGLR